MANQYILIKILLSLTDVKDNTNIAKDVIFSEKYLLKKGLKLEIGRYIVQTFYFLKKENKQLTQIYLILFWQIRL